MPPLNLPSSPDVDRSGIRVHIGSIATLAASWTNTHFDLDTSGVAGFFAGDVALSAMVTNHIYVGRRWLCWYNQPGSYEVARRYGQLAQSCVWDALYPGPDVDPASLFHFHGPQRGPNYISVGRMSIVFQTYTGYVARLFLGGCKAVVPCECLPCPGEETAPGSVTVVELEDPPESQITPAQLPQTMIMKIAVALPILASVATSTLCGMLHDWYSCFMILFGVACNGITSFVAGRAALEFRLFEAPSKKGSKRRTCGILHEENDFVVMNGEQCALDAITHGRFEVRYGTRPNHHDLGCCAILLSLQLLAQLLVVPQGHLYGQLFFLISFAFSWGYNSYLSSPDVASLLRTILFERVLHLDLPIKEKCQKKVNVKRYRFRTRTETVVFTLLLIASSTASTITPTTSSNRGALLEVLDHLLPDVNTPIGKKWKAEVVKSIEEKRRELKPTHPFGKCYFRFNFEDLLQLKCHAEERDVLRRLCVDADAAATVYEHYQTSPPRRAKSFDDTLPNGKHKSAAF